VAAVVWLRAVFICILKGVYACSMVLFEGIKGAKRFERSLYDYHRNMKAVFITGASSGIGAALARQYAELGASVGLVARRQDELESLRRSLTRPSSHKVYALDVNDHVALVAAANDFILSCGTVNIVVACAGISIPIDSEKPSHVGLFAKVINTNLNATVATFSPFIAHMRQHANLSPCRLVGIASIAGVRGFPQASAYSASKAATISYCESLRVELKRSGIKVVTIAPGFVQTPMTASMPRSIPFFMPAESFAKAAIKVIERGDSYSVLPWQMGVPAKLLRLMPNWIYDRVMGGRAKH
jgi:short-subunit dehydrogenase